MRIFIRKLLTPLFSVQTKRKVKRWEANFRKKIAGKLPAISKEKFRKIMTDRLLIQPGDHLFVHGALTMMNVEFSNKDALEILLDIVGESGSVTVPTFPIRSSIETMTDGKTFDVKKTRSGMGALAEAVRQHPSAIRSVHPIKSVASVGVLPDDVFNSHHLSKSGFDKNSPFVKMLEFSPKIIGIGVPMRYVSYVHVAEDIDLHSFPKKTNSDHIYNKICILASGETVDVETSIHDMTVVTAANPEKFVRRFLNEKHWQIYNNYITPFFSLEALPLINELKEQARRGNTIYD